MELCSVVDYVVMLLAVLYAEPVISVLTSITAVCVMSNV